MALKKTAVKPATAAVAGKQTVARAEPQSGGKTAAENAAVERIAAAVRAAVEAGGVEGLRIVRPAEASRILGRGKTQLELWRARTRESGRLVGPPFLSGPDGRTIGYPLMGLIDWIVRQTIWGDERDQAMFALAAGPVPEIEWTVARSALGVLMPIAAALALPGWAEERERLLSEGWREPGAAGLGG